ncbi:MAG: chemotaxis response regulator protein-glutamate methylesterase [Alphaproteobacteria bacterium]
MSTPPDSITVMVVDDSSVIRRAISNILESDNHIKVVASVSNGQLAVSMAKSRQPDITILDVEMPVMDGLSALPEILKYAPNTKVIMCSTLTDRGADISIKAMALGAVECLVKPSSAETRNPDSPFKSALLKTVKSLAPAKSTGSGNNAHARRLPLPSSPAARQQGSMPSANKEFSLRPDAIGVYTGPPDILAIGSSTGGPKALFQVLGDLGRLNVPIVITQHMPATFTKILAAHITHQTGLTAHEGADGMSVEAGKVYIAPGSRHLLFTREGGHLTIRLDDGPPENYCKPAVDPMLRSLIGIYGKKVLCLILTGMGNDGLKGSQLLVNEGGRVIAQNEETSVVWGMPGAVSMAGLCSAVLPLPEIGSWIRRACR